ncbi:MAG: MFS transporter [Gaiellales bacterium]
MRASPRVVLLTATAAQAASSLVTFGLPAISPELRDAYDLSLTALGVILTVTLLGSGLMLIPAGVAVDRYGSRRLTLLGTGLAVTGLLVAAFTTGTVLLASMLFVCGVGSAIIPIAGIGALFHAFEPSRRAWALGVRQMAVPLGGVVGAIVLPSLAHTGGVRPCLVLAAVALAGCGTAFGLLTGDDRPAPHVGRRPPGLLHGLRAILGLPGMGRLLLCAALLVVVLQAVLVYGIPSARDAGLSRFAVGAMFFAVQITAGVARVVWGRIADRGGGTRRIRTLVEAAALGSAGTVVFAAALHAGPVAVIPASVLLAFGALGWNALVYVRAGEMAPQALAAQAVAIAATLVFTLSAVSTPPMGALAQAAGWDVFWLVCAGLCALAAVVAWTLRRAPPGLAPGEQV